MGEVVPPSEELLNLAVQGLLMLGESQVQLPTYEVSHDMHADNDVHIDQSEQEQLRGGAHGVGVPESDEIASSRPGDITTEGPEGGEDAFRGAPSIQRAQETVKVSDGLDRIPGRPVDKRVQRREHPRDGIHGAGIPDIVKLVHRATARTPETQAPGMKDPPWLPDSSTGRLSRREDDTMRPTMQIISSQAKSSEAEISTSRAYYQTKYFPHSEWDYEVGGFVPCDPPPQPMMLGKITVLIKSMGAWKIKHGVHPVGTLFTRWERLLPPGTYVQDSSGGPSVETYMGYQA